MLSSQLRVGDRVVMQMDKEARVGGRRSVADGTEGTVLSKTRMLSYQERIGYLCRKQGVYEQDGMAVVSWDNGVTENSDGYSIFLIDKQEAGRRYKEEYASLLKEDNYNDLQNKLVNRSYVGPLPDTKFWEGDEVWVQQQTAKERLTYTWVIQSIQYYMGCDERGYCYDVGAYTDEGLVFSQMHRDIDMQLVKRGAIYNHYHNLPVTFSSLGEEINFEFLLDRAREVRNPETRNFSWTMDEVIAAVKAGIVDGFNVAQGFFGAPPRIRAQRFENRDLGERVRAKTLAGFSVT